MLMWCLYPVVVQVGNQSGHVFALNKRLVLGRQRTSDPAPIVRMESDDEVGRIVIASRSQATIGRTHVQLELESNRKVRARRLTDESSVEANGRSLKYSEAVLLDVPVRLRLGPMGVFLRLDS